MQQRTALRRQQFSFWLSLAFHILLVIYLLMLITTTPPLPKESLIQEKQKKYFVPAYTYSGSIKPKTQKSQAQQQTQSVKTAQREPQEAQLEQQEEHIEKTERIPEKTVAPKQIAKQKARSRQQPSLIAASFNMLQEEQMRELSQPADDDPIYLIGDDSQPADPLIKMMGHALSKHFRYPPTAGQLGIRGKVVVELTLNPGGHFFNVHVLRSSANRDLDEAALYAVNRAPKVYGADRFISKPKRFVVGFVFY